MQILQTERVVRSGRKLETLKSSEKEAIVVWKIRETHTFP